MHTTGRLDRGDGVELAWARQDGKSPTVVFLSGNPQRHDRREGDGACRVLCRARSGHAAFRLFGARDKQRPVRGWRVSRWTDDALAMIDRQTNGPLILVGSSMGGWIALLAALVCPGRVAALVGIAAAPDFTEALMWPAMTLEQRDTLERDGVVHRPSQYGEPTPITRALIEDGLLARLVLTGRIQLDCPVRLLHRQEDDPDVPWRMALLIARTGQQQRCAGDPGEGRRSSALAPARPFSLMPDACRSPQPGWHVVPRGSLDSASAGRGSLYARRPDTLRCSGPEASCHRAHRGPCQLERRGFGYTNTKQSCRLGYRLGAFRRFVIHQVQQANTALASLLHRRDHGGHDVVAMHGCARRYGQACRPAAPSRRANHRTLQRAGP